jgi:hypothetical protein
MGWQSKELLQRAGAHGLPPSMPGCHTLLPSASAPASAQHKRIFWKQGVGVGGELNPWRRRLYTGLGPEGIALKKKMS